MVHVPKMNKIINVNVIPSTVKMCRQLGFWCLQWKSCSLPNLLMLLSRNTCLIPLFFSLKLLVLNENCIKNPSNCDLKAVQNGEKFTLKVHQMQPLQAVIIIFLNFGVCMCPDPHWRAFLPSPFVLPFTTKC